MASPFLVRVTVTLFRTPASTPGDGASFRVNVVAVAYLFMSPAYLRSGCPER
jgi:hypothetical protein